MTRLIVLATVVAATLICPAFARDTDDGKPHNDYFDRGYFDRHVDPDFNRGNWRDPHDRWPRNDSDNPDYKGTVYCWANGVWICP